MHSNWAGGGGAPSEWKTSYRAAPRTFFEQYGESGQRVGRLVCPSDRSDAGDAGQNAAVRSWREVHRRPMSM